MTVNLVSLVVQRPGVAGAVLQTPALLTDSLNGSSFSTKSSEYLHYQTVRARELKFRQNVPFTSPLMCHMLHFM